MKKYKIEFYSKLLDKRIVKVVENPKDYKNCIILEVIEEQKRTVNVQAIIALVIGGVRWKLQITWNFHNHL